MAGINGSLTVSITVLSPFYDVNLAPPPPPKRYLSPFIIMLILSDCRPRSFQAHGTHNQRNCDFFSYNGENQLKKELPQQSTFPKEMSVISSCENNSQDLLKVTICVIETNLPILNKLPTSTLSRFTDTTNNGVSDVMIRFKGLLVQSLVITINYNNSQ
jgi:hypothetical protein